MSHPMKTSVLVAVLIAGAAILPSQTRAQTQMDEQSATPATVTGNAKVTAPATKPRASTVTEAEPKAAPSSTKVR
jgi:hypothetical protein